MLYFYVLSRVNGVYATLVLYKTHSMLTDNTEQKYFLAQKPNKKTSFKSFFRNIKAIKNVK